MLFYVLALGFAPVLGIFYMARTFLFMATFFKAVLIGLAVIIMLPRLISVVPVVIFLAVLGALVGRLKHIVG